MVCPFCGKDMEKGVLSGDGRSSVTWKAGDKKANLIDKLGGSYKLGAAKYTLTAFTIESYYCSACKKMIFDTDIEK